MAGYIIVFWQLDFIIAAGIPNVKSTLWGLGFGMSQSLFGRLGLESPLGNTARSFRVRISGLKEGELTAERLETFRVA